MACMTCEDDPERARKMPRRVVTCVHRFRDDDMSCVARICIWQARAHLPFRVQVREEADTLDENVHRELAPTARQERARLKVIDLHLESLEHLCEVCGYIECIDIHK